VGQDEERILSLSGRREDSSCWEAQGEGEEVRREKGKIWGFDC